MKMLHLQQIESAIPKLINIDLPIKYAYKLNIIMDAIQTELSRLQQFRVDFLNRHGSRQEDGTFQVPTTKIQEFDDGMGELFQEEIDIIPVEIPLSLLIDSELKITVLEIESLKNAGFIIDDISSI